MREPQFQFSPTSGFVVMSLVPTSELQYIAIGNPIEAEPGDEAMDVDFIRRYARILLKERGGT